MHSTHIKDKALKEAIKLQDELNLLYTQKYQIKPLPLDEPYQKGYKKFFVISDFVLNKSEEEIKKIKSVLRKTQKVIYSQNPDFTIRVRKKIFNGKTIKVDKPIPHVLNVILEPWHTDTKTKAWIEEHSKYLVKCGGYMCDCREYVTGYPHIKHPHYKVRYPWYYESKVEPNIITHYIPIDAEIESRIKHIYNIMERKGYWYILQKHFGSGLYKDDREDIKYRLLRDVVQKEIRDETGLSFVTIR